MEWFVAFINFIKENWTEFLAAWGGIVTLASLIVRFTPSKKDDAVWEIILRVLNALALNPTQPDPQKVKEEVKKEIDERDDDSTRSALTNALR